MAGGEIEQMTELLAGGLAATLGHRLFDHLVDAGLSQPQRAEHRPVQQRRIVRQLGCGREDDGRVTNRLGAEIPLTDHHQRQAVGGPADVRGARAWVLGSNANDCRVVATIVDAAPP